MPGRQPLVSACIIARNEEAFIGDCLRALRRFADELIVGDTGSTDRTVEIAEALGARVLRIPWTDDFSAARNAVLDVATGTWLFSVDCDEVLRPEGVIDALEHLANDDLPPALLVTVASTYPGGRQLDMLAPRLFRRAAGFRYIHAVHEQLDADGADAALTELTLEHRGYMAQGASEAKERRNLAIARKMPDSPHAHHSVARAATALREWSLAIDASRELVNSDCGPLLLLEGCAIGGGAALAAGDHCSLQTFLMLGKTVCADAPDIRLLELLSAGEAYLASIEKFGLDTPGEYLRAPVFRHCPDAVRAWLAPHHGAAGKWAREGRQTTDEPRAARGTDTEGQEERACQV